MEIWRSALSLLELMTIVVSGWSLGGLKDESKLTEALSGVSTETPSAACTLQGTPRTPVISADGDFIIGGVFSIHYQLYTVIYNYTTKPEPPRCTGRLVRKRGCQEFNI